MLPAAVAMLPAVQICPIRHSPMGWKSVWNVPATKNELVWKALGESQHRASQDQLSHDLRQRAIPSAPCEACWQLTVPQCLLQLKVICIGSYQLYKYNCIHDTACSLWCDGETHIWSFQSATQWAVWQWGLWSTSSVHDWPAGDTGIKARTSSSFHKRLPLQ